MEDDEFTLPADTLKILNEFLLEKAERENRELEAIKNKAAAKFEEDWQLSQFWYSESTKSKLGELVKNLLPDNNVNDFRICLLSCPSLYSTIKEIHANVKIFEFDERFSAFGDDFIRYDINDAHDPNYLKDQWGFFDLIIADPPFLSEECIAKISIIIKNLRKEDTSKIIFCSGEIVEPWLTQNLQLVKCKFCPEHERNLGNEFVSFANFNLDNFIENVIASI